MSPPASPSKLVEDHNPQGYVDYASITAGNLELTDLTKDFDFDLTDVDVAAFENVANEVSIPSTSLVVTSSAETSSTSHPQLQQTQQLQQSQQQQPTPSPQQQQQQQPQQQQQQQQPHQHQPQQQHQQQVLQQHVIHVGTSGLPQGVKQKVLAANVPSSNRQIIMVPASALISAKTGTGATATFLKVTGLTPKAFGTSTSTASLHPIASSINKTAPSTPKPQTKGSSIKAPASANLATLASSKSTPKSQPSSGATSTSDFGKRKPCNCTKSQCLKLYCDCFANGEFCKDCKCTNCFNNVDHEEERQKAIRQCLDRNPQAFHPKIGKATRVSTGEAPTVDAIERRHIKGCNCKRSGCLKNYCECYEAKILCSNLCKCCGCKNYEESFERKTLMHLADAVTEQSMLNTSSWHPNDYKPKQPIQFNHIGSSMPCSFITNEVIQATSQCLITQADEAEAKNIGYEQLEQLLIEEFGKCLTSIIDSASKSKKKATRV
ncbi:Protein lin-54-like protein, partial [Fragariocoptes setiger]